MPLHTEKCRRANKRIVCGLWSWLLWWQGGAKDTEGEREHKRERHRERKRESTVVITFICAWAFFITHLPGIFVLCASSQLICDIDCPKLPSTTHPSCQPPLPLQLTPACFPLCGDLWQMWHVYWPRIYSVTTGLIHLSGHLSMDKSVFASMRKECRRTKQIWLMQGKVLYKDNYLSVLNCAIVDQDLRTNEIL